MNVVPVILTCGHSHIVSHDSGERIITCRECSNRDIVKATKLTTIQYTVSAHSRSLLDEIEADNDGGE